MRLEKYHGLGNDFLVLLDLEGSRPVDGEQARALCDRRRGVGADGLIRVTADGRGAAVAMQLFNADGRRAEMSGNGIRCLALALADAGLAPARSFTVSTDAGLRTVEMLDDGQIAVDMGAAQILDSRTTAGGLRETAVDMGNPHVVVEVADPAKVDLAEEAALRGDVNVEVVAAGPGPDEITVRVHERGVGETQACGTGASAAAAAAAGWGLVGDRVTVRQPGGDLQVHLGPDTVTLTGPAVYVGSVEVPDTRP
ncbi:MAG: diaminopimelate epimerase [Acidimicrobiales bacterium]